MNAIAYIRSAVEDKNGEILRKQETEIKLYCRQNGLKLLHIFIDSGKSGLNFDREGWTNLKDHLENYKGLIQYLIVTDLARISRNASEGMTEIQHLEQSLGIKLRTVLDPLNGKRKIKQIQDLFLTPTKKKIGRRK